MFEFILPGALATLLFEPNTKRWVKNKFSSIRLKANCLLTESPLIFITGQKNIFYFIDYWNRVPRYLKSHGYEVHIIHLPWKDSTARANQLKKILAIYENAGIKNHYFIDESSKSLADLLVDSTSTTSVNLVTDEKRFTPGHNSTPYYHLVVPPTAHSTYKLAHPDFRPNEIETLFLEHAIFLAESEM